MAVYSILGGFVTLTIGAGGGMPGGSDTQVQFNDAGAFGGDAGFTFNKTTNVVTLGESGTAGALNPPAVTGATGLALTIAGGTTDGANTGGALNLNGGRGGATGVGGNIVLSAGQGGATSGNGGVATLRGGLPVDGDGGAVQISGRNGIGTNRNGGNVTIESGNNTGSGNKGVIQFNYAGTETFTINGVATTGAQTATFAATNKPGSATGGPTLWIPVRQGATQYWVPCFAD